MRKSVCLSSYFKLWLIRKKNKLLNKNFSQISSFNSYKRHLKLFFFTTTLFSVKNKIIEFLHKKFAFTLKKNPTWDSVKGEKLPYELLHYKVNMYANKTEWHIKQLQYLSNKFQFALFHQLGIQQEVTLGAQSPLFA